MENIDNDGLQVICLGLFRCATHSMKVALEILGYDKCYHFFEFMERPQDEKTINELCEGKSPDLKELFKGCKSVSDVPMALFYKELYNQYPNAKFILNTRDAEKWYSSSLETVYYDGKPPFISHTVTFCNYMWESYFEGQFTNKEKAIEIFNKHFDDVRKTIPKEKLLEFNVVDGWEPLCKFLNVDVPKEEFPKSNSTDDFKKKYDLELKIIS